MCMPSDATPELKSVFEISRAKSVRTIVSAVVAIVCSVLVILYVSHRGFRRSVQFWSSAGPWILEFKFLKARLQYWNRCTEDELHEKLSEFHRQTAPKLVQVLLKMGGIYIKLGQLLSNIGGGFIDDSYVLALKPLQDGVPPRPIEDISRIIERSVGKEMSSLFQSFDEYPVGAASIAQAHKAVLLDGTPVIVKVQYPEVAELYEADFNNLELAVWLAAPDQRQTIEAIRNRHQHELDFRQEASHMRECSENMQRHGLEPKLVRIPKVSLATQHVLAMEYFEGISLAEAMDNELDDIARAVGMNSAGDLRKRVMEGLKAHFEEGHEKVLKGDELIHSAATALSVGMPLVRTYTSMRQRLSRLRTRAQNGVAKVVGHVSKGHVDLNVVELPPRRPKINLSRVLKTLVMVHGVQVLQDGVYNADPHPGNVIILSDGNYNRLGLIDYGMVGRLQPEDRLNVASTVLALHEGDKKKVVDNYRSSGYRIVWNCGTDHLDHVYHRAATLHLDRIDLSPLPGRDGELIPIVNLLQQSIEGYTPDWIEQMKRIGTLLIGVSSQAGRPVSLAREWHPIARQVMKDASTAK